ncbi:MAG: class I SAM-dependent methyltransferase [Myxococcales bacterium]|nr:class I SAM-dependent methyltransferase [Myxococcales bacterium]HRC54385.1 TylF/MycF/NovP-related O-methyltransferase [Kofleriaceae bacterium]
MSASPATDVFDTSHYASGLRSRLRRSFELGAKYYLYDVPRYFWMRKKMQLPVLDWKAYWNPVRSFRNETYLQLPLPPHYEEALELLFHAGVRIGNPRSRTEALTGLWWEARTAPGDVIECGAYQGATSLLLAVLGRLNGLSQRVLMLDTFAGMPEPSRFDLARRPGEFAPPTGWTEIIAQQAEELGVASRVEIHKGLFTETFDKIAPREPRFSFAHIDANIFEGTRDACEFVLPRITQGGAVVFDDYNGLLDLGARLAIDASLRGQGQTPSPLAECSAFLRR